MRARPARIMAELRAEYGLTVREAWRVYRGTRDTIEERMSLAAVSRHARKVREIVRDIRAPELPPIDEGEYDYEITVPYER